MKFAQDGQRVWNQWLASNPPPDGYTYDVSQWPEAFEGDALGDAYGAIVMVVALQWAEAMEHALSQGATSVASVAEPTYHDVKVGLGPAWGLTGFQYGACVAVLANTWERGEDLRRWHNLRIQVSDEGERANESGSILNPALVEIDVPEEGARTLTVVAEEALGMGDATS